MTQAAVPLDAWQVGPHNRWAYVHVDEVVPTAPVPRGSGPVRELPRGDAPAAVTAAARRALEELETDGLAILHDGALVFEAYGGEMDVRSLHLSQSVGKSVLGLLVGALELDADTPVTDLVPEVRGSGWEGATLRHLLDMRAAIGFVEDYAVDFWRYDVACAWHPPHGGAEETVLEFLPTVKPAEGWRHGERFHYATPNTDLLGIATARAAGAPLQDLIARELWAPLGAEADALLTVDHAGTGTPGGGFCATLRDYARLGQLVLERGAGIVPEAYVAELGQRDIERSDVSSGADGYRAKWWRRDGRAMARGIHGQMIAVDQPTRTVVAVFSSWPEATDARREAAHRELVTRVCAAL